MKIIAAVPALLFLAGCHLLSGGAAAGGSAAVSDSPPPTPPGDLGVLDTVIWTAASLAAYTVGSIAKGYIRSRREAAK